MNNHCIHSWFLISQHYITSGELFYQLMRTRLLWFLWTCQHFGNNSIFSTSMEKISARFKCLTNNGIADGHLRQAVFIITKEHSRRQTHHALHQNICWTFLNWSMTVRKLSPAQSHSSPIVSVQVVSLSTTLCQVTSVDNSNSTKVMNEFNPSITVLIMNICMRSLKLIQVIRLLSLTQGRGRGRLRLTLRLAI